MADVAIAYVHSAECSVSWAESMWGLREWDMTHDQRIGGRIRIRCGFQGIPAARNEGVRRFLETGLPWLFWVDTDMGFKPDTLDRLLASADPAERPVVGALCFAQKYTADDGFDGYVTESVPTLYGWISTDEAKGFVGLREYPEDELGQYAGTGSAAILIHRNVLQVIGATRGPHWYDPALNPTTGAPYGEDLSFCLRCAIAGFPVHVHTGVRTNHMKYVWLSKPSPVPAPAR